MHIGQLRICRLRNLLDVQLQPAPHINVLTGPNGSGKTAMLEAIHILARGRSFRTARVDRVVRQGESSLQVTADVDIPDQGILSTGIERGPGIMNIRFDGEKVARLSEQADNLPLTCITPDSHELITGSPAIRRKWLDWAMFHVEPRYMALWQRYHKALKQRNQALKSNRIQGLTSFEEQLQDSSTELTRWRLSYLEKLGEWLQTMSSRLDIPCPQLDYQPGWDQAQELAQQLLSQREQDRRTGSTGVGLHRSDVHIHQNGTLLAHHYSRGQIKLLVNAIAWGQAQLLAECCGRFPIILADDLLAELDTDAISRLVDLYKDYAGQLFISAIHTDLPDSLVQEKLFHVKHGEVNS